MVDALTLSTPLFSMRNLSTISGAERSLANGLVRTPLTTAGAAVEDALSSPVAVAVAVAMAITMAQWQWQDQSTNTMI